MENPFKILVGIDLSEMDDVLIRYAMLFMNTLQAGSLVFVHIHPKKESGTFFGKSKESENPEVLREIENRLRNKISSTIDNGYRQWELEVLEGDVNDGILSAVKNHKAQLLIMGRKDDITGPGSKPNKIVLRVPCSVLFVPEEPFHSIKNILVPTDFSDFSALAVKESLFIANQANGKVICYHLYEVPIGYHRTGKDYHEFAKVMENNARKDAKLFIKKHGLPENALLFEYGLDDDNKPAKEIYNKAKEVKVDMICIGSKGRTAAASMVLGSVAEGLVSLNTDFPLLVMKKNEENLGFFDALSKL